jgi:hypothetical protein
MENKENAMASKRVLVIDAYNVIKVFRKLGVSFEEITALGCRIDGEPGLSVTPDLLAVWYEEEKEEREKGIPPTV